MSHEYEGVRRVTYDGGGTFVPVCAKCGRFVKPDETIQVNDYKGLRDQPNADCKRCGRTLMLFEGFI